MTAEADNPAQFTQIDKVLRTWRQGDCVLGEHWFVHRINPSIGLTDAAREAIKADVDLAETQVNGFVVVTQTCDVVRLCTERPFVEICPLIEVDADRLNSIKSGRLPTFAFLPQLADRRLVADLNRVMTIEKSVAASWERTPGWSTDEEGRRLQLALARKRSRFAFPDDFTSFAKRLQSRLSDKHTKDSDEGRGLRALREIRVQVSPSWDANPIRLMFWFIRHDHNPHFEGRNWVDLMTAWLGLLPPSGRFTIVNGQVAVLRDLTAEDYVFSDSLDLEHLTSGT